MKTTGRMSRRTFIKGIIGGGVLLAAGGLWLPQTQVGRKVQQKAVELLADGDVMNLRQMMTQDPAVSRHIMWQSAAAFKEPAFIEYRRQGSGDALRAEASERFFTDDGVDNFQYGGTIEGLEPGNVYEYRVASGDKAGDWQSLTTPAKDQSSFKALIFPDSQSNDYSDWKNLVKVAAANNPDANFFVNMGDLVDNGEDHTQWQAWFGATEPLRQSIPFAPIMGNHETYNQDWKVRLPHAYLNYFDLPENGSRDFQNYYYSYDYGDVHFVMLSSEWDETEEFRPGLLDAEVAWLRDDLAKTDKKWKVAMVHRDVLQYRISRMPDRKEGFSEEGTVFMPIFEEFGVDLVYTAHLHTYRNRGHLYQGKRDERGPLYILTGVAGNVRYPGLWTDHALDDYVAPQPETDNYIVLAVNGDTLTSTCHLPDGTEIDRSVLQKA